MKICVYYYDGFVEFEIVHVCCALGKFLTAVAVENKIYTSIERQKFLPDITLSELNPDDVDIFVIPGGNPAQEYENTALQEFLFRLNEKGKIIAGICGGAEIMAFFGLLDGKRATGDTAGFVVTPQNKHIFEKINVVNLDVVRDGNLITAMGQAYCEFAVEIQKAAGVFATEEEAAQMLKWYKNIK